MTNTNIIRKIKEQFEESKTIPNPDSVLKEYMKKGTAYEDGTADKIMDVYNWSHDRRAVIALFKIFTGESFDDYLRVFVADSDHKEKEIKLRREF